MNNEVIYGWVIINKETGERAGTRSKVFETKNSAGAGFYQWTKRLGWGHSTYIHLKDKKLSEQDEFEIKPLVILESIK